MASFQSIFENMVNLKRYFAVLSFVINSQKVSSSTQCCVIFCQVARKYVNRQKNTERLNFAK